MKKLLLLILFLNSYANAQVKTETLCSEKQEACVLFRDFGNGYGVFLTDNAAAYNSIKKESPSFNIQLIDSVMMKVAEATSEKTTTISSAEEEAAEAALDEFQISANACVSAAATCVASISGSGLALVYNNASRALNLYGLGVAACIITKPTCRDMAKKWNKYKDAKSKLEKSSVGSGESPSGPSIHGNPGGPRPGLKCRNLGPAYIESGGTRWEVPSTKVCVPSDG